MPDRASDTTTGPAADPERSGLRVIGLTRVEVYEFHDAEAGRTFRWNATEGRRLAEARNAQIIAVHLAEAGITREALPTLAPEVDRKRALALPGAALLVPLLFVEHRNKHVCVDGWHRITKAVLQGFPVLPAYVLTQAEADAIRLEEERRASRGRNAPSDS